MSAYLTTKMSGIFVFSLSEIWSSEIQWTEYKTSQLIVFPYDEAILFKWEFIPIEK